MENKPKTTLYEDEGHIVARAQRPAPLGTPKPSGGLAAGDMLGRDPTDIVVMCYRCRKPLMIVHQIKVLSPFSTYQKPATPLGPWEAPKLASDLCPLCGEIYSKYNEKQNSAQYLTSIGLI